MHLDTPTAPRRPSAANPGPRQPPPPPPPPLPAVCPPASQHPAAMAEPTEYELARAHRMAENRRKMEAMGLVEASRGLAAAAPPPLEPGAERAPRLKKRRAPEVRPAVVGGVGGV